MAGTKEFILLSIVTFLVLLAILGDAFRVSISSNQITEEAINDKKSLDFFDYANLYYEIATFQVTGVHPALSIFFLIIPIITVLILILMIRGV